MASISMTAASFLGRATVSGGYPATANRRLAITNSAKSITTVGERVVIKMNTQEGKGTESNSGRRDLIFAAAAAAAAGVCSVAGGAVAGEPKRGSLEAKKVYAPVCVTMPTAKICHK